MKQASLELHTRHSSSIIIKKDSCVVGIKSKAKNMENSKSPIRTPLKVSPKISINYNKISLLQHVREIWEIFLFKKQKRTLARSKSLFCKYIGRLKRDISKLRNYWAYILWCILETDEGFIKPIVWNNLYLLIIFIESN